MDHVISSGEQPQISQRRAAKHKCVIARLLSGPCQQCGGGYWELLHIQVDAAAICSACCPCGVVSMLRPPAAPSLARTAIPTDDAPRPRVYLEPPKQAGLFDGVVLP